MTQGRGGRLDRRSFVKGCVGAGAAAALVGAGYGVTNPLSGLRCAEQRIVRYVGAKNVGGPAPRPLPLLPVAVGDDGVIRGKPTLGGESVLDWYKYCGHETAPGLQEDWEGDEALTFHVTADKLAQGYDPWFRHRLGEPITADAFPGVNTGASATWRSGGEAQGSLITALVIRVDPDAVAVEGGGDGLLEAAGVASGFLAFVTFCTHFCCVPGYKEAAQARSYDAWGDVFCTCHQSVYDPFTIAAGEYPLCVPEESVLQSKEPA